MTKDWKEIELKPGMIFYGKGKEYPDGTTAKFTHIVENKDIYKLYMTDGQIYYKPHISIGMIEDSALDYWDLLKNRFDVYRKRKLGEDE